MADSRLRVFIAALLTWCLLTSSSAFYTARTQAADPVPRLDAEFGAFAAALPPHGTIGFLDPHADRDTEAALRVRYAAQYALAPRVLSPDPRVRAEYLIVAGQTAQDDDPAPAGYTMILRTPAGHRLYRRVSP